jgi:hypothetical protein
MVESDGEHPGGPADSEPAGDSVAESEPSSGLNACEDSTAWAIAHFGADPEIVEHFRRETREGIRARLASLPEGESERLLELEAWRERARQGDQTSTRVQMTGGIDALDVPARWRPTLQRLLTKGPEAGKRVGVRAQHAVANCLTASAASAEWPSEEQPDDAIGFRRMSEMGDEALAETLASMGVWQIAGIVSGQGRRRAARARSRIPSRWTSVFLAGLRGNSELAIEAATRIQEVYLGLRRRDFGFDETAERLGLFSVTSAAGGRFESRLSVWARRVPEQTARIVDQFEALNPRGLRQRIGPAFRRSLRDFWAYFDEELDRGGNDE